MFTYVDFHARYWQINYFLLHVHCFSTLISFLFFQLNNYSSVWEREEDIIPAIIVFSIILYKPMPLEYYHCNECCSLLSFSFTVENCRATLTQCTYYYWGVPVCCVLNDERKCLACILLSGSILSTADIYFFSPWCLSTFYFHLGHKVGQLGRGGQGELHEFQLSL